MYFRLLIIIMLIGMIGTGCNEESSQKAKQSGASHPSEAVEGEQALSENTEINQLQWIYSLSDGLKLAKEENKPLMVDFYADWCGWCKKLDKDTYTDSDVIKLSNNFICVKVDTDKNPDEARNYKVSGLPTIVFLKSNGEIIEKVVGYRGSKDFIRIMSEIIKK